ncbi:kinase suppressor of Ras 2 [Daktulosphaira vitifoliae]|uniref:kinase suppressor of Ras 2 n=1 Tax=Daktulosphaira vitifoliae TaxID=58002 RepID=UPI0021AA6C44|nr:kinase suppressor of Ras 2 [Daktulosphaira vitifoliae]
MAEEEFDRQLMCDEPEVVQTLIDISSQMLISLRNLCETRAELTQHEIRTLEGKLVKLFSVQLNNRQKNPGRFESPKLKNTPSLKQWLEVVGLSTLSVQRICDSISSIEVLLLKSESELKSLLPEYSLKDEELRRLTRASFNLKKYSEIIRIGNRTREKCKMTLYWDSWYRQYEVRCEQAGHSPSSIQGHSPSSSCRLRNSHVIHYTPPLTPTLFNNTHRSNENSISKLTSPKNQRNLNPDVVFSVTQSHDNNQVDGIYQNGIITHSSLNEPIDTSIFTSSMSPNRNIQTAANGFSMPQSPKSSVPDICIKTGHKFSNLLPMFGYCDQCSVRVFVGVKCKICKYRYHKGCLSKLASLQCTKSVMVDDNNQTFEEFLSSSNNHSPNFHRPTSHKTSSSLLSRRKTRIPSINSIPMSSKSGGAESSSAPSSTNSSTPSSPALVNTRQTHVSSLPTPVRTHEQFQFPDTSLYSQDLQKNQCRFIDSRCGSSDSEHTSNRIDVSEVQNWDADDMDTRGWPRQNSLSLQEWDIPWDELNMCDKLGEGHFGTVYSGNWHGPVAIKVINMDYLDYEKTLEAFKAEVATFRKTRHENLILFMGACMKLPRLAIVTSLANGMTLYRHIHVLKDKFNMSRTTMVAQQISQGMGYLHAKGIIHKDLRSKNIFLENGKVIITDFGLFSVTRLCFRNRTQDGLIVPPGWLCYLAPELVRNLRVHQRPEEEDLPFSKASDVYAFGTVWYELLCGEWPFKSASPEVIIWNIGRGMKQRLANLEASGDVKDILMTCWSFNPGKRPDFAQMLKTLERLPRKRLARSPSHPIHLSRSAESIF